MSGPLLRLVKELRRRRVFRVAGIYIVFAWVAVQVFSEAFPALDVPAQAIRYVWLAALLGFPLVVTFTWFFDLTAEGIVRTPERAPDPDAGLELRRIDYAIIGALVAIAFAMIWQLSMQIRGESVWSSAEPMSIAVLPFENLSGDPEQAWFVSGMHDALITELSRISGLKVISRTSTLGYAGSDKRLPEIADELNVEMIIEGSVFRAGDRVRIVVQLIDADEDEHIWAENYERDLTDALRLQADITRAIAEEVQIALTSDEERVLMATGVVDAASYEAYLKGNFHVDLFTPEDMAFAQQYFERSIELDSESALGHSGLNRMCRFQLQAGLVRPREGEPRCRAFVLRALALDSLLPEAHMGLALGYWVYDYDWVSAETEFLRAIELRPNYAEAHMFYSHFLASQGRFDESDEHMRTARELDPFNPFMQGIHGVQQIFIGNVDEGIGLINAAIDGTPGLGFGYDALWGIHAREGRFDESYDAALKHFGITMGHSTAVAAMERGYAEGGFARAMLETAEVLAALTESEYVPAVEISLLYELGGDMDLALHWLEVAYDQHDPTLPYLRVAPLFDGDNPMYADLRQRMKLDF